MKKDDKARTHLERLLSQASNKETLQEKKKRAYEQETNPPIPLGMEEVSIATAKKSDRKLANANVVLQKGKKPLEQIHCNENQNYPLFFIEKADALRRRLVKNLSFKERFIAARNLKKLSQEMQQWIHKEVKLQKEENPEFYELLQKREERHFQIDRIIRYLSDT